TEREPRSVILETLRRGDGVAIRARQGSNTIGLALAHRLRHPPVLFVVYLAVAPELRSRHIGAVLFEKLWEEGLRRYSDEGLKAEGMSGKSTSRSAPPANRDLSRAAAGLHFSSGSE